MANVIMGAISEWISGFTSCFVNVFESLVPIFYNAPTGSGTTGSLTLIGHLSLAGLGIALVFFGFRLIMRLVHLRG